MRRFAARQGRKDANHATIAAALRRCGASVVDLHAVGGGVPDLLVGFRGNITLLMEVKVGDKATHDSRVRERQAAFAESWRGWPVVTVRNEAEALTAIGVRIDT